MSSPVSYERKGNVGVITVNNPPVNALGHAVRQGFADGLKTGLADDGAKVLVVIGGGRTFPAGADITEFGKPLQEPGLTEVIDGFENSTKPVIAAVHGTALGGGMEIVLGCHFRVAATTAMCGLPEVKLGIIPGAGGTQRLPRIVGAQTALEMITSGNFIKAPKALKMGIFDELIEGDLEEGAVAFAEKVIAENRPIRKVSELSVEADSDVFENFRKGIARKSRGYLSPFKCIDSVENATKFPFDEGMAKEREIFIECLSSPQSAGQRFMFFAERTASKVNDVPKDTPLRDLKTAGVLGAGTMGGGIAMNFLNAGIPVTIVEMAQEALDKGIGIIRTNYENTAKKGRLTQEQVEERMALLTGTTDMNDLASVDIVIEAVFENMEVKKDVFAKLNGICKEGAILASNTSTLDVNEIASVTDRPQDVIGLHFFSPANVMPLLEIVRGAGTAKDVLATCMKMAKKISKVGVVVGVCEGFVGNRMLHGYLTQSQRMIEEGATPAQVDKVIFDYGLAMGPFTMADLAGNDVGWRIRLGKLSDEERAERSYTGTIADRICDIGRFGQKTSKGWYDYKAGDRTPYPSDEVLSIIEEVRRDKDINARAIGDDEILKRCIYALVNEGAKILEEGIAQRSSDIDVIYIYGYGFPPYRGGPMFYADQVGLKNVYADICKFQETHGDVWEPAPLLKKLAEEGKSFSDL
ncbi:MAG: 3-hydroxyacyl-CoA dehydrogenase NAD-binding domain-containing protein [Alphaproteobacteria bacterium]|nr:3-hydroxyacyl-CoA dehydrogenase NAD-binding domain-containing protein [Alphaproteobacteria bacterium]